MDHPSSSEEQLRSLYGHPRELVAEAWAPQLEETSSRFISASSFMVFSSVNEDGFIDMSPRGGTPGFIRVLDEKHIAFLDQPGNKKLHTLSNLLANRKVGMMFVIPGIKEVLRAYGAAEIAHDEELIEEMGGDTGSNKTVITIRIEKVFPQCSKALNLAGLWDSSRWLERSTADIPELVEMATSMAKSRGA